MNNNEIKHNIKQTEDYLDYLKAIEVVVSKAAEATARMYTESEVDKMLNESRTEGYKDGEKAERQRCIEILKPLEKVLSKLEQTQKDWELNSKYDTENVLRNRAIIDVINQSKALSKLSKKVE